MLLKSLIQGSDKKVFSLQLMQIIRAGALFLIAIFLTKIYDDTIVINQYETLLLIGSSFTFFWVSSLITTFLPHYYSSSNQQNVIFNSFALLSILSIIASVLIVIIGYLAFPELNIKLWLFYAIFLLFNSPAYLTEYILLIRGKSTFVVLYAIIVFSIQVAIVVLPLFLGKTLLLSMKLLAGLGFLKYLFTLFLLQGNTKLTFETKLAKEHLSKSLPIAGAFLLGGSSEYIDGYLVKYFEPGQFALFRYGARELPLTLMFATALSNVIGGQIASQNKEGKLDFALNKLKNSSARLMHFLYPLTFMLLFMSEWLFEIVYNHTFIDAHEVFNIYLLLIVSRLTFPHSIAVGLEKNNLVLKYSTISVIVNIVLSVIFVYQYGIIGVAWATIIAHYLYKLVFVVKLSNIGIKPQHYINITPWLAYSIIAWLIFLIV